MPTTVREAPYRPVPVDPRRKKWTRTECEELTRTNLFEGTHYELIEGELIDRIGKKRGHTYCLHLVLAWLVEVFGIDFINVEASIDVAPEDNPTSERQPDLIVLNTPNREIRDSNPTPADIRLLIEISDSTLGFDLTRKAALYARAGIPEYWVLDVASRRMIVHRDASAGRYSTVTAYDENESVSPLAAPQAAFRISAAF
jgi:Uma2 family endonuclease